MYQSEHKRIIAAPSIRTMRVLLDVVPKLGWDKLESGDSGMLAELLEYNPSRWFTLNITCIHCGEKTELLLTICSNESDSQEADRRCDFILDEAARQLRMMSE